MVVRGGRGQTAAQRAGQHPTSDEEGFDNVLDRVGVLLDAHRDRLDPHRVAAECPAEHPEHSPVELVEPDRIDAEDVERRGGDVDVDAPSRTDLGIVTGSAEQAVDDARGPARAPGDHRRTLGVEIDAEQARRPVGDGDQVVGCRRSRAGR